jgi:uncharacterized coiled-coil DUF342 family protein
MNTPAVAQRMSNINNNIRKELANAPSVVAGLNAGVDLKKHWDTFFKQHILDLDKKTWQWVVAAIRQPREEIAATISKYKTLADELTKKEDPTHRDFMSYRASRKQLHARLEPDMNTKKNAMKAAGKAFEGLKAKDKLKMNKDDRTAHRLAKKSAGKHYYESRVLYYTAKRALHSIYSHSVIYIIKKLEADERRLINWAKDADTPLLKLTPPKLT